MKAKKLLQELIETIKSAKHYPKEVLIEDLEAILNSFDTKKGVRNEIIKSAQ